MSARKKNQDTFLTPEEREAKIAEIEKLKEIENAGDFQESSEYKPIKQADDIAIDPDKIRQDIKHLQKQLDEYSPRRVTNAAERDKILNKRRELEHKFKPYLETFRELRIVRRDDPDYMRAVEKARERLSNPAIEGWIREWKRLGLMLDPDNPDINNLDRLRERG